MRPGLCAEKPAGNRRHRRQGPAATDASLSHLLLSRLPAPELSVLPRAGRKICHAILASLSPAKKAGAPKGVAAIFRCRWRRSSIMAGCSGQDGDDEGILFRNELDAPPSRTVASTSRHGTNRSRPNNSGRRTFSRPHTRHRSLPQSGLGLEGGMGCGGGGGGERGAKFPRFPAVPASSPCSQHDFVSLLCVEISGTASSLSRAMFHHHHQPSPRLAVCIVDASTPLSISAHGFANRSTDDIEEGGKDASTRSLSRWACQERVVMPCSLIFTLTLHVREAHSSPSPLLPQPSIRARCGPSQGRGISKPI